MSHSLIKNDAQKAYGKKSSSFWESIVITSLKKIKSFVSTMEMQYCFWWKRNWILKYYFHKINFWYAYVTYMFLF